MKYTNNYNLPEAFVRAIANDPYSREGSDFSPSSLALPSRAWALIERNYDRLTVDVSTRVASIIGQGSHLVAERAARSGVDIAEKRYFSEFCVDDKTYKVSAQIDLFETNTGKLYDWKTAKTFAFFRKSGGGKKPEWIAQMNIGAELMRRNGLEPLSLTIIAFLKDWNKGAILTPGYPQTEVMAVDLPMWPPGEVEKYIQNRIRSHVQAKDLLPMCTKEEAWYGRRCEQYCEAAQVCNQYHESRKTGIFFEE